MGHLPWFPFYPKDWLDFKVLRMSLDAQGAYIRLLCHMWSDSPDGCSLNSDLKILSRILSISQSHMKKIWKEMMPKDEPLFVIKEERIISLRLKEENEKQQLRSNKARESAESRWKKMECERIAVAKRSVCSSELESEVHNKNINNPPIVPPLGDCEIQKKNEIPEPEIQAADLTRPEVKKPVVPVEEIVALYREILPELPRANKIKPERRKTIMARWNEDKGRQDLDWWREYFESVRDQDFLMGENDRGFRANIDFLVTKSKMTKVEEGQYGNSVGKSNPSRQDKAFRNAFSNLMAFGVQNESDGIFETNGTVISNLRPNEIRRGPGDCQSADIWQGPKLLPAPGPGNGGGHDFGKLETHDLGALPLSGDAPGSDPGGSAKPEIHGRSRGAEKNHRKS
jgi:uncharacterized protein YdaU (DUF1376 family)